MEYNENKKYIKQLHMNFIQGLLINFLLLIGK